MRHAPFVSPRPRARRRTLSPAGLTLGGPRPAWGGRTLPSPAASEETRSTTRSQEAEERLRQITPKKLHARRAIEQRDVRNTRRPHPPSPRLASGNPVRNYPSRLDARQDTSLSPLDGATRARQASFRPRPLPSHTQQPSSQPSDPRPVSEGRRRAVFCTLAGPGLSACVASGGEAAGTAPAMLAPKGPACSEHLVSPSEQQAGSAVMTRFLNLAVSDEAIPSHAELW